ncbi:MAG: TetR/AcrR family transcriptional regulator [Myxococcales bacterium]
MNSLRVVVSRRRRTPAQAQEEIVEAAERFLRVQPLGELTVSRLMQETSLARSSFYVYFQDVPDVVARLLERLVEALMAPSRPWLDGAGEPEPALAAALDGVVDVWREHGPVLRAVAEASLHSGGRVREVYLGVVIDPFVAAVARRIQSQQRHGSAKAGDPHALARALILLNERYLVDTLGADPELDPAPVAETLRLIWGRVLYGEAVPGTPG